MDKKEIKIGDRRIFYRVFGAGAVVVLVHGFGEDGEVWAKQAAELSQYYTVIVPDIPGSGHSASITDMSLEALSDVLKQILDIEAVSSCTMIGHSMGGYITLAFAERHPDYLKAFGLFHSTAFADSGEKKAVRRKGIDFIREHGAYEFLESTTPNLFSAATRENNAKLVEDQIQMGSNFSADALVSYYEAMILRPDRTAVIRNSTKPILFVAGKYDNAIPAEDILKQCHLASLSYIHILENSGHMGMLEEPGKSNLILKNFLLETG